MKIENNLKLDTQNVEQQKAFDLVANTNTCLFITGKAGTGKTTFVKRIQTEIKKNFLVLAPTGIAAIAVGGQTMHSFFGFPFQTIGPHTKLDVLPEKKMLLREVDTIIVDEASMVRSDMVDGMDRYLRMAFNTNMAFGGKQVVFVGDLFQLPPVVKQGSADGRLIIWKAALTTWIKFPWFGVGIGGFYHAFAEGMTQLFLSNTDFSSANVPDGTYNILLKVVVEQGVVGGIVAILLATFVLLVLLRNSRPLFWGGVSLLIFAMFSYPFDMLAYKVIAVLIVAWSESMLGKIIFEVGKIKVMLIICLLGFASWQAGNIASNSYKKEYLLSLGGDLYSIEEGYESLHSENDNHEFLFTFGKKLREEGRYNDSNAVLRQGTMCSADPMFYVLMGNNYKDMKHYDLAEQAYQKAYSVMPNRLYPLYQLMMLYHDCGNTQKEKAMAKRVIEMRPKIESPATRDMKKKAMEII